MCGAGHSFDAAKQGYFNLLVGKGTVFEADTADMVAARFDFLSAGHYRPLAEAVAAAVAAPVSAGTPFTVLDAGTGTGHYLRAVLDVARRVSATHRRRRWTSPSSLCAAPPGSTRKPSTWSATCGSRFRWRTPPSTS